ncbi:MAG: hypothetical protein AB1938_18845 [Myxococcota bacterium]
MRAQGRSRLAVRRACWAALLALSACANARIPRVGGDPPPSESDPKMEAAYQQVLERYTRSQAVYDNLDTNVFFHATWQSPAFVEARMARDARFRAIPAAEAAANLAAEQKRLADAVEFHLAVHANDYKFEDFNRADTMWRLALVVDGREVTPTDVNRLGRTSSPMRSIYSYMEPFWVGYRVRFPKVDLPPGTQLTFRLASALGKAELVYTAE